MARRKKKDPLEEVLGGIVLFVVVGVFMATNSVFWSLAAAVCVFVGIGMIIMTVNAKKQKKINESGILQVDKMTGVQFEDFLMLRYKSMGFMVKGTPTSGDFGADLLLVKGSNKIVVQAKRYSKTVGLKAVQEVNSAKPHYKANEAWVVTNNYFTPAAKKLAATNNVRLIDRDQLIEILHRNVQLIK